MKKATIRIAAFFACLLLLAAPAYAAIDLSEMSYEELVELKDQINHAIWRSKEWESVTVPQGEWVVGEDIPEGHWTIRCADVSRSDYMMKECELEWGFLDEDGDIDVYDNGGGYATIYNPDHEDYDMGEVTEIDVVLEEGMVFSIDTYYAPAVFTKYEGKQDLGFH